MTTNVIEESEFPSLILHSKGFRAINNNCFLNSVLSAMFMYTLSPFFIMETEDIPFREDIKQFICPLYNDEDPDTSSFRKTIKIAEKGQQDASEALCKILDLLQFNPPLVHYHQENTTFLTESNNNVSTTKVMNEDIITIHITNESYTPINDWFNLSSSKLNSRDVLWTQNKIIKADCLIFNIIRYNNDGKINKRIETPTSITTNGIHYFRAAVVCHEGSMDSGHYVTLFWDGYGNYYKYNDLGSENLSECSMSLEKYENKINKDGNIFFYYKWYF